MDSWLKIKEFYTFNEKRINEDRLEATIMLRLILSLLMKI